MADRATHWDQIFATRSERELGWYEPTPATLADVLAVSSPADAVIDVGAGTSGLVHELLARGYGDVTLLDLSAEALDRATIRLSPSDRGHVTGVVADVTSFDPERSWDVWHDRAVFHFLVDDGDRDAYRTTLRSALRPGGRAVITTFAPDGPESCAGLPVRRYDAEALAAEFAGVLRCDTCRDVRPDDVLADVPTDRRPYTICTFHRPSTGGRHTS